MEKLYENLPIGITGFWSIGNECIPETRLSLLKTQLFTLGNNTYFSDVNLSNPTLNNNYYVISLLYQNNEHKIAINSSYHVYCGIKKSVNNQILEFYTLPKTITKLMLTEFTELKTDFLNSLLKPEHLLNLDEAEIKQIHYWRTKKIGNVIFNNYD